MILNLAGKIPDRLEYEVAIFGAGPAGITLALTLSKAGIRVGLFEAGEEAPPLPTSDHPYKAENKGRPYDLANSRLRYLGGTSNHWGGWCRPLDCYDFEAHPSVPLSGWPISRADLNS
jgi:choline dehydrogenase-like flavoprotein